MILNHQFESSLPDEEPFIFNLQFDDNGELILGDGTKNKPVRILLSSKCMINFLREKGGVAHFICLVRRLLEVF
jgi:hypothetical protein